jgi:hypothetical protein
MFLQIAPVPINPSWSRTGTPLDFRSLTASGSASLTKALSGENTDYAVRGPYANNPKRFGRNYGGALLGRPNSDMFT